MLVQNSASTAHHEHQLGCVCPNTARAMRISSISWVVLVLQAARAMCISSMSWVVLVQNSARGAHQHHLGVVLVRVQPGQCASAASDGLPLSEGSPGSAHHEHQLGFACAEQCGPCASSASVWGCACAPGSAHDQHRVDGFACPKAARARRISSISWVVLVLLAARAMRISGISWLVLVRRQS